jgi:adenine-specific DNA-methyltransferase
VHERIDPSIIIEAVRRRNGNNGATHPEQPSLFERREENPPLRDAVDFYRHPHGWSNRLIAGDSLLVMNSLLEKEGMAGQVQMVYFDPPYGIKYGSNFQPFVNKRDVKDGNDEDLTQEPEMIRAFRDTWELGIHSYLTYLRDRLALARDLLTESGSIFVQIGDENIHFVRNVLDDVFGAENFCSVITIAKTAGATSDLIAGIADYLVWFAKDKDRVKYRQQYSEKGDGEGDTEYRYLLLPDGTARTMTSEERTNPQKIPAGAERFRPARLHHSDRLGAIHSSTEGVRFGRANHSIGKHPSTA